MSDSIDEWSEYKKKAQIVAESYLKSDDVKIRKQGKRIQNCASKIAMSYEPIGNGKFKERIVSVNLCKVSTCPICQWRRKLSRSE